MEEQVIDHAGLTIKLWHDNDTESPNEWGDDNRFLVGFCAREFWVEFKGITEYLCQSMSRGGKHEDGSDDTEAKEMLKKYHFFPIEAYIHSGVVLHLRGGATVDRRWDVSDVGAIFLAKEEWEDVDKAKEAAKGLIKTWNMYLSGDVWGYTVETADGEHLDSCGGYYGYDECLEAAKENAEYHVKEIAKERAEKLKALIKHKVPLSKRAALLN